MELDIDKEAGILPILAGAGISAGLIARKVGKIADKAETARNLASKKLLAKATQEANGYSGKELVNYQKHLDELKSNRLKTQAEREGLDKMLGKNADEYVEEIYKEAGLSELLTGAAKTIGESASKAKEGLVKANDYTLNSSPAGKAFHGSGYLADAIAHGHYDDIGTMLNHDATGALPLIASAIGAGRVAHLAYKGAKGTVKGTAKGVKGTAKGVGKGVKTIREKIKERAIDKRRAELLRTPIGNRHEIGFIRKQSKPKSTERTTKKANIEDTFLEKDAGINDLMARAANKRISKIFDKNFDKKYDQMVDLLIEQNGGNHLLKGVYRHKFKNNKKRLKDMMVNTGMLTKKADFEDYYIDKEASVNKEIAKTVASVGGIAAATAGAVKLNRLGQMKNKAEAADAAKHLKKLYADFKKADKADRQWTSHHFAKTLPSHQIAKTLPTGHHTIIQHGVDNTALQDLGLLGASGAGLAGAGILAYKGAKAIKARKAQKALEAAKNTAPKTVKEKLVAKAKEAKERVTKKADFEDELIDKEASAAAVAGAGAAIGAAGYKVHDILRTRRLARSAAMTAMRDTKKELIKQRQADLAKEYLETKNRKNYKKQLRYRRINEHVSAEMEKQYGDLYNHYKRRLEGKRVF